MKLNNIKLIVNINEFFKFNFFYKKFNYFIF